jgi:CheY-like chemotaxis protein
MAELRMLLVEDDDVQREKTTKVLSNRGWTVETAGNGQEALDKIRSGGSKYDVIVLDLRMPKLTGEEVLERIQDEHLAVPPIIVLSAYLKEFIRHKCFYLGATYVLEKPYDPDDLGKVAQIVAAKAPLQAKAEIGEELLDYMVKRREESLKRRLSAVGEVDKRFLNAREPLLVVARRWNSWYPSIFPVIGGAYAIVGAANTERNDIARGGLPVALIDPGFQFMRALTELRLPWQDMNTCVITHNHPDHLGGVFEFMASRHAAGKRTRMIASPACTKMLGDLSGFNLEFKPIDDKLQELIPVYPSGTQHRRVRVRGFNTVHDETGRQNSSQGLCIAFESGSSENSFEDSSELVIVGDTEYDRSQHKDKWMPILCKANVGVVVLHIGSSQVKQRTGKHLYLPGLRKILNDMDSYLQSTSYRGRLLVLVSEWGLEHATADQINGVCGAVLPGFDSTSPIIETVKHLQNGLIKICLLPADLGLVVGVESGRVYLKDGASVPPEKTLAKPTIEGLRYVRKKVSLPTESA